MESSTTLDGMKTTEIIDEIEWDWPEIVAIIFVVIAFVIYIPITIYFMFPLYKTRNELIFQKRHSTLTLYAIYTQIASIAVFSLFQLVLYNVGFDPDQAVNSIFYWILIFAFLITVQFIGVFFYSTLFIRLFLTYYDIKYNMLTGSNEWKHIIDENYNATTSWFVKFRTTLGNERLLNKINLFISLLTVITAIILAYIDMNNEGRTDYCVEFWFWCLFINFIGYCIASSVVYYLLRRVKYFDDLHIIKEFFMFYKLIMTAILVYILYFIILSAVFTAVDEEWHPLLLLITLYFLYHSWMLFHILVTYIFTRWVFKQLSKDSALQLQYGSILNQLSYQHIISDQIEMVTPNTSKQIKLTQILERKEFICSFMQHLSYEFSMECLLALIELFQFRQFCEQMNDQVSLMNIKNEELSSIHLASDGIPKSSIVYNKEYGVRYKARQLFEKYIAVGAPYEININSKERTILIQRFEIENDDKDDELTPPLIFVFDKCIQSMLRLLGYSLSRFKRKPEYLKLLSIDSLNCIL